MSDSHIPSADYVRGYLAALGNVDFAIRTNEVAGLEELREWIEDEAEGMAK